MANLNPITRIEGKVINGNKHWLFTFFDADGKRTHCMFTQAGVQTLKEVVLAVCNAESNSDVGISTSGMRVMGSTQSPYYPEIIF